MSRTARVHRETDLLGGAAILLTVAAAFVLDPFGFDRWVFSKELALVAAALLSLFVVAAGRAPAWWKWWVLAGAVVLLIGALTSGAPLAQLLGRWPRYEGVVTLSCYVLAVTFGARVLGGTPSDTEMQHRSRMFHSALSLGLLVTAVVAIAEAIGLRPITSDLVRPGSLLGNASDLGIVGVIGLALLIPRVADPSHEAPPRQRWVAIAGLISSIAVVALSASRGAMVAGVAVLVILFVIAAIRAPRQRSWLIVIGSAGVLGAILVIALPSTRGRVLGMVANSQQSASNRIELWSVTGGLIADHALLGVGANGFADAITARLTESWYATTGIGGWIESPHSLILQVAAAGGVLGILCVVALVGLAVRHAIRSGLRGPFGPAGIVALVGAGIAMCTHFTSPGPMILLCVIAGATFAARPITNPSRLHIRRSGALVSLTAWASILVLSIAADHSLREGMDALSTGDAERAESSFQTAHTLRVWDADIPLMVSESFASAAETSGTSPATPYAAEWSAEAVQRLPSSTRALKAQAVIAQYSGDLPTGIRALKLAAELSPTDPEVFHRLGALQFLERDPQSALISLEKAERLAPEDADINETLQFVRLHADEG